MQETGFAAAPRSLPPSSSRSSARRPPREAIAVAEWAIDAGLPAVELTATTPDWRDALRRCARSRRRP